jgi:hypothetical protein
MIYQYEMHEYMCASAPMHHASQQSYARKASLTEGLSPKRGADRRNSPLPPSMRNAFRPIPRSTQNLGETSFGRALYAHPKAGGLVSRSYIVGRS